MKEKYDIPNGWVYVQEKVKNCVMCQDKTKVELKASRVPLRAIPVKPWLWGRVHFDLAGPFPVSNNGNTYFALAVCAFSKYIECEGNLFFSPFFLEVSTCRQNILHVFFLRFFCFL